ncbi:MAG: hypothetical protein HKN25_08840, partial [Pyrinomonadaceae bacterium]|nr:hypothetical protein [Pyrinomonadaceae bacterium]
MSFKQISTPAELAQLVAKAQDAELAHDYERFRGLIKPYWEKLNEFPDFGEDIAPEMKAELFRLCGWYLCFSGQANNAKYQERGKEIVSKSVELFEELGEIDLASKAKMLVASTYFNLGRIS